MKRIIPRLDALCGVTGAMMLDGMIEMNVITTDEGARILDDQVTMRGLLGLCM